jgi:drug/metabolite transporter (DMT)-like permease
MIFAGLILLGFTWITHSFKYVIAPWKGVKSSILLMLFSIFAMLGIQLTYFMTIKYSNAATATILQFTSPVIIIAYVALKNKHLPSFIESLTVLFAVVGTFLLITQGNMGALSIPLIALIWGLLLAVSNSLYILMPVKLLHQFGTLPIVAWSFFIGGVLMNFFQPFWIGAPPANWTNFWILLFMVIPSTALAYLMELQSIPLLPPVTISLLQAAEPISATLIAVLFMGVSFNWIGWIGVVMVIGTVFVQSIPYHKKPVKPRHA